MNIGLQTRLIECEVDIQPAMPGMVIVGLPDKAVQESKERVRSAVKQSGYEFPLGKVVVNLAPAGITKFGSGFDLPIAVGVLRVIGVVSEAVMEDAIILGELGLDANLRPVSGVLSTCLWAKNNGYKSVFLPKGNASEASLVKGLEIYPVNDLKSIVLHLNKTTLIGKLNPVDIAKIAYYDNDNLELESYSDIIQWWEKIEQKQIRKEL